MPQKRKSKISVKGVICLILATIFAVLGGCYIGETYSRFRSAATTLADIDIAKWSIAFKDGTQPLSNSYQISFTPINNAHTATGKFAPASRAAAQFVLDLKNTEVAIDYNITVDLRTLEGAAANNITLSVTEVSPSGSERQVVLGKDVCIPLGDGGFDDSNGVYKFDFVLMWKNDEANNAEDTRYAMSSRVLSIPMSVKIKQHIGEITSDDARKISSNISYVETLETKPRVTNPVGYDFAEQDILSDNPERGFYSTSLITLTESGAKESSPAAKSNTSKLLFLKVDLTEFSGNMNGSADKELTTAAISAFSNLLKNIKQNDNTVIIRFVYDGGKDESYYNDNHIQKLEPAQEMIEKHIQSLGDTFKTYAKTINAIQMGFYGQWGECSRYTTATLDDFKATIQALLAATQGTEITIAVRKPQYYAHYKGIETDIDNESNITVSGSDAYRVGIFNDGIGGNESDLGTFSDRTKETGWLKHQSAHTFYGGEAIVDESSLGVGDYNTSAFIIPEAFRLHMTYLNWEWNQALHAIWASEIYSGAGSNAHYNGKSALAFIESRLGYRFVLKECKTYAAVSGNEKLPIDVTVENVGFGNLVKSKRADIVITDARGNAVAEYTDVNIDAKGFLSQTAIKKSVVLQLNGLATGEYKVFLRLSSGDTLAGGKYYSAIRLANNGLYDVALQANYIASFKVVA